MTSSSEAAAAAIFAEKVTSWRTRRGYSMKYLAARMGYDASYLSHVEKRRHRPTEQFAFRAESALAAELEIVQAFRLFQEATGIAAATSYPTSGADPMMPATLVIEDEVATLIYLDGWYRCLVERVIHNVGKLPVTHYPVRIDVDRFPDQPQISKNFYRETPLELAELDFTAHLGDRREPLRIDVKHNHDAFKKIVLFFGNESAKFPLYPGEKTVLRYSYRVPTTQYGHWFQRDIRFPTRSLTMTLKFPAHLHPEVTGASLSYAGTEPMPLERSQDDGDAVVYSLRERNLRLTSQVRVQWSFPDEDTRAA